MLDTIIAAAAIVGLVVALARQQSRLRLLEREVGALRSLVLSLPPSRVSATASAVASPAPEAAQAATGPVTDASAAPGELTAAAAHDPAAPTVAVEPHAATGADVPMQPPTDYAVPPAENSAVDVRPGPAGASRPQLETALGTRWAVWVGGVALALGGVFLVRYSIESGMFGPRLRLFFAALFGLLLLAGGEMVRRTGFRAPVAGAANAYIPAILTAAGALTLFATIYAAHGLYGFIGPTIAFFLLGLVAIATIALAIVHGQALAGLGLLGALLAPALVASEAPSAWALFGYLAIVLAAAAVVARSQEWKPLMAAAFAGAGLWTVVYLLGAPAAGWTVVLFINLEILAVLGGIWLAGRTGEAKSVHPSTDWVSIVPALFVALNAIALFVDPRLAAAGGAATAAVLIAALLGTALWRERALPLLHGAGAATVLIYLRLALAGSFAIDLPAGGVEAGGLPAVAAGGDAVLVGAVLGLLFLAAGLWSARRFVPDRPGRATHWAGWAAAVPLAVLGALWLSFGDPDRDLVHGLVALLLCGLLVAGAEWIADAESPPRRGGRALSAALAGSAVAWILALHMAFGPGLTTILVGATAAIASAATRLRAYPVLGWIAVAAAAVTAARVGFDPTIVGTEALSATPVFNWLLPGYGLTALAFVYAAWQLRRTTDGRPRLVMEAAAALFALLAVAMLVRHAMNGGVIDAGAPTLAEHAIYTLLALGAGGMLIALDLRSPSPVLRVGSLAFGVVSVVFAAAQHVLFLNPLATDEATGRIPFFNLLFLAYLLPAIAAGALGWYARGKRPRWYSAMLALLGAVLGFFYATLSVRRLFQGEFIAAWRGFEQLELYSYSALWLTLGVLLLAAGVRFASQVLRVASAVLITVALAKAFLFDMSELEGVLRALSFIGLGAVLIGIGLFYQRLLTRSSVR